MTRLISTPFTASSTADDVIEGVDLVGARAIVTGASSGLGTETAPAAAGAEVTLAVRNTAAGHAVADAIAASSGAVRPGSLEQRGLNVQQRQVSAGTDCAARSYGRVRSFFRQQPCTGLFRALFDVRDAQGDTVVVAVAWVDMPHASQAGQFQRLVDGSGTGNVTELPANGVRFTGEHYTSVREGVTVVNAQAEPAGRTASAAALAGAVTAALR